ncbi:N-acetylmuramic acid/N-acetylglucosamine kinase [Streptomyces sp. RB5]|uniref:N-acetylmuramic acid/N-acetylglucosamine kinase n=1 Tax=Streptomyces smaragdinus TaxID=2585196 RepID=A0A7K0CEE5_9ACTN|nr:BadF/BadG/BcrA/BcrD ATPase family protein [Streptomyces smaragdinus]MQY11746.1 N-acetylmuramic acid/N-acetylglucosamine kinase [Streptomyces smaragdinus]
MTDDRGRFVLGVDSGGSGVRVAVAAVDGDAPLATLAVADPAVTGARGIDAASLLERIVPAAGKLLGEAGADRVDTACVGAAGMATLGGELRERLPAALAGAFGVTRLALAADAVTAYAGALGQRRGAVVAAGTGMIALGTALDAHGWRRADGWGHLLGDCGGGAWIGRAGLEAALRCHDGRDGGSAPLLARLEAVLGPAAELPGRLYPRADRPAVLASFAPEVAACAAADPVAAGILRDAAGEIVTAAAAVCPEDGTMSFTGGLLNMGAPLLGPLDDALRARLPHVTRRDPDGDPLLGAVRIARALAGDALRLPVQMHGLLHIA